VTLSYPICTDIFRIRGAGELYSNTASHPERPSLPCRVIIDFKKKTHHTAIYRLEAIEAANEEQTGYLVGKPAGYWAYLVLTDDNGNDFQLVPSTSVLHIIISSSLLALKPSPTFTKSPATTINLTRHNANIVPVNQYIGNVTHVDNLNVWTVEAKYMKRVNTESHVDTYGHKKRQKEWQERTTRFKMTDITNNLLVGRSCTNEQEYV